MKSISKKQKVRTSIFRLALVLLSCACAARSASWKIAVVDSSGVGRFSSLRIDKDENAHVAYTVDDERHSLKYAFWDHALKRWFNMRVAEGAQFCSLVLDSKQRPHISWVDYGTGVGAKVHYAYWDGQSWKRQNLPPATTGAIGYYTSIALDKNEYPMISYYDYAGPGGEFILRLRTFVWNGKYWEARTVDPEYGSGKFNCIATDSAGSPHIAYANVSAMRASLRYASWNGHSWASEILEGREGAYPAYSVSMILDKGDSPHIAYTDVTRHAVKYASRRGGKWQFEDVDLLEKDAYPDRNGIALDEDGTPYLSYYDAGLGLLKLAHREGQKWIVEVVDQNFAGFTSSVQIDRGTIWIAYADETGGALKLARRELDHAASAVSRSTNSPERTAR